MTNNLDLIAGHIKSAETLNALHACRPGHPLGRDNGYKFRNAYFMVTGRPYSERSEIDRNALRWLKEQAEAEANVPA